MQCWYHDDFDGRAAAFAVLAWVGIRDVGTPCRFIPMAYAKTPPIEGLVDGEQLWIVDFSMQAPGNWEQLLRKTADVTWIDHHKTAIERARGTPAEALAGIRSEGKKAGCVLTFEYIHWYSNRMDPIKHATEAALAQRQRDVPVPEALVLVGDRDTWEWEHGKRTAYFHAGLGLHDTNPEIGEVWRKTCMDSPDQMSHAVQAIVEQGEPITRFKERFYRDLRESIGFEVEIDGHRALAMNVARVGSEGFGFEDGWRGDLPEEWPILLPFYWDGSKFTISLYSKAVDVSQIAKKHGGGGHPGAAGFQADALPGWLRDKS